MPKTLIRGRCNIPLLPLLVAVLAFSILISLGVWQVFRLQEKELFLNLIKNNLNNEAIDIKTLSGKKFYAKVKIKGEFLADKNLHLYGQRRMSAEKDGYYLITPFKTEDNKIILVARGWFSSKYKKNIDRLIAPNLNMNEIIGVVLPGERKKLFIVDNDIKNNIWFTLDITQAAEVLGLRLENFYLIMDNNNGRDGDILKNLQIDNLLHIRNDHLEYAITWFSLAIGLAVIFIIFYWRYEPSDF